MELVTEPMSYLEICDPPYEITSRRHCYNCSRRHRNCNYCIDANKYPYSNKAHSSDLKIKSTIMVHYIDIKTLLKVAPTPPVASGGILISVQGVLLE